jgi:hypothetical protein
VSDHPPADNEGRKLAPSCGHTHSTEAKVSALLTELREHMPFSISAVAIGLVVAGTICILIANLASGDEPHHIGAEHADAPAVTHDHEHDHSPALLFFHLFHPAHMLFSAAATTAMFCRYERKVLKAIIIGLIGAIGICGISDIAMPHVSVMLLGPRPPLHICILQHPLLILPFALVGVLIGLAASGTVIRSTVISHSLHVLASTMASIFYMVGPLGLVEWIDRLGLVFLFVVLAVMIPCCLSDIVFPLLMSKQSREAYGLEPHCH